MNFPLELLTDTFAICRLDFDAPIPDWTHCDFVSITRTWDELSIVCRQDDVPDDVQAERGWRCLRVVGKLEFSLVGVIAILTKVLAESGISVFVVSTFDTDYFLVRQIDVNRTVEALKDAGLLPRTGNFLAGSNVTNLEPFSRSLSGVHQNARTNHHRHLSDGDSVLSGLRSRPCR